MATRRWVLVGLIPVLAGCASRLNPLNWFGGRAEEETVASDAAPETPSTDPEFLVTQVTALTADRRPGGLILRAVGLPPTQGYFDAELFEISRDGGRLTFDFRVMPPPSPQPAGSPSSRELIAARDLSERSLDGIREIAVQGLENRLVIRR